MKKITICLIAVLTISSCSIKTIPLKNDYSHKPFEFKTTSSFEDVWTKTIELFAKEGIGIKLIDKSSGLIIAQNNYADLTTEDNNGKLINPKAYGVTDKLFYQASNKYYYPKLGEMQWNIFIKRNNDNGCTININVIEIVTSSLYTTKGNSTPIIGEKKKAYSLGVFEKQIANEIK